jgi:hypothetical protein
MKSGELREMPGMTRPWFYLRTGAAPGFVAEGGTIFSESPNAGPGCGGGATAPVAAAGSDSGGVGSADTPVSSRR